MKRDVNEPLDSEIVEYLVRFNIGHSEKWRDKLLSAMKEFTESQDRDGLPSVCDTLGNVIGVDFTQNEIDNFKSFDTEYVWIRISSEHYYVALPFVEEILRAFIYAVKCNSDFFSECEEGVSDD